MTKSSAFGAILSADLSKDHHNSPYLIIEVFHSFVKAHEGFWIYHLSYLSVPEVMC